MDTQFTVRIMTPMNSWIELRHSGDPDRGHFIMHVAWPAIDGANVAGDLDGVIDAEVASLRLALRDALGRS